MRDCLFHGDCVFVLVVVDVLEGSFLQLAVVDEGQNSHCLQTSGIVSWQSIQEDEGAARKRRKEGRNQLKSALTLRCLPELLKAEARVLDRGIDDGSVHWTHIEPICPCQQQISKWIHYGNGILCLWCAFNQLLQYILECFIGLIIVGAGANSLIQGDCECLRAELLEILDQLIVLR